MTSNGEKTIKIIDIFNSKKLLIFASMMLFAIVGNTQETKSYMQMSIVGQNQYGTYPQVTQGKVGCYITWDDNGNMVVSDGTKWRFIRRNWDGSMYYRFAGTTGQYPTMPGTQYTEALVSSDKTAVKIAYNFGMMGYSVPMVATYGYIGEGSEAYFEYMRGNY
jgi:hypothetical protein